MVMNISVQLYYLLILGIILAFCQSIALIQTVACKLTPSLTEEMARWSPITYTFVCKDKEFRYEQDLLSSVSEN